MFRNCLYPKQGLRGSEELKLTGEIFGHTQDGTQRDQTRAKEWYNRMKAKQRFHKTRATRHKRDKERAVHHSRRIGSPSELDRNKYRKRLGH